MLIVGLVSAVVVAYYHQTETTIVVDEARSSADLPLTITGFSGETICRDVTIKNLANVPLKSVLSYTEDSNPNSVTYTSNLNGGLIVTTNANETNTYQACFTIGETTEAGSVVVTIKYQKTA
jgi:hypothetical protein